MKNSRGWMNLKFEPVEYYKNTLPFHCNASGNYDFTDLEATDTIPILLTPLE